MALGNRCVFIQLLYTYLPLFLSASLNAKYISNPIYCDRMPKADSHHAIDSWNDFEMFIFALVYYNPPSLALLMVIKYYHIICAPAHFAEEKYFPKFLKMYIQRFKNSSDNHFEILSILYKTSSC